MLSKFNIARLVVFSAVIVWTLIVLGIAAHLDHMLVANDLTRYIPLGIFVAVATLLIVPSLIIFGFPKRPFLIQQVRLELAFVGLLGLLWFILGIVAATGPDTEVECDFDDDGQFEESDEFSTDTYHAQFHTLEAFSIFNAILLLGWFFFLLLLTLRHHRAGHTVVWRSGVTTYPWFGSAPNAGGKQMGQALPAPVTAKVMAAPSKGKDFGPTGDGQMKAGGHYIIYIPPPATTAAR
ncbi:hypothetical protein FRB99_008615 [Tulasnella sp. 403]|nr:hypothetical protein FRB99_008615 [Tulasnella sp. 403]